MLKESFVKNPFVEKLEHIPGYVEFMKYLVTRKRIMGYEPVDNVYYYTAIVSRSLVERKENPGAFTIPFTIQSLNFARALYGIGENINLMPLVVFKKLWLGTPKKINEIVDS